VAVTVPLRVNPPEGGGVAEADEMELGLAGVFELQNARGTSEAAKSNRFI
jgi:hypothetical protein